MSSDLAVAVDVEPTPWSGRDDGPGAEHLRWHHVVSLDHAAAARGAAAFVGFRSDEGVRRNKGRQGAADGPRTLRAALASMALPSRQQAVDVGDVEVDDDLEGGHRRLGDAVAGLLDQGLRVTVLGGGHEVAYGSYLGIAGSRLLRDGARLGVLNLDAHFDLRDEPRPSSGTPFLQIAEAEAAAGRRFNYWVLGISQPSNTATLFRTAQQLGVRYLADTECGALDRDRVDAFVEEFLAGCDVVHLTIDLDVLPAGAAPGVSAPAAYGVPIEIVEHVCTRVAASGKPLLVDVAELNPDLDVDNRTARAAARLVHRILVTSAAPAAA